MTQGKPNYSILYHLQILSSEIDDTKSLDDEYL